MEERIAKLMFAEFGGTSEERFLQKELIRYVPQLSRKRDDEIADFVAYQRRVYLDGGRPTFGRPIASLNPRFVSSIHDLQVSGATMVYTRASVKENGYRMQLHVGPEGVCAFTRQFTRYDLRMFPEFEEALMRLPVMIGDVELVNRRHRHLAGFNRVQIRIPDQTYWPREGETGIDDGKLETYRDNLNLFEMNGLPKPDLELALAFHGLFAIADPDTWKKSREIQAKSLISFGRLPVDYISVDTYLSVLRSKLVGWNLDRNVRVVDRFMTWKSDGLEEYIQKNDREGYEGTCIVQTYFDKKRRPLMGPGSVKVKKYETMDCALLGLHLKPGTTQVAPENLSAATVGLYDQSLGRYLAVTKVNLDPQGVQVKTEDQKSALKTFNERLVEMCQGRLSKEAGFATLYEVFLRQGARTLAHLFKTLTVEDLERVFLDLPPHTDLLDLIEIFEAEKVSVAKGSTIGRLFIIRHLDLFRAIDNLDTKGKKRFISYFVRGKEIRRLSAKLERPSVLLDVTKPVIVEIMVFDIKWGASPYPAGFHSWYGDSFRFANVYPARIRHDKSVTTDYETVYVLASAYTPK
jgi:hypothetical protein